MCGMWTLVVIGITINTSYYQTLNLSVPCFETEKACIDGAYKIATIKYKTKPVPDFACLNRGG